MTGPEFGPGGYLPPKAAKRARKIILREQMGWGWPAAAVAAAILVAVTGVLFLRVWNRPPSHPFVPVGGVWDIPSSGTALLDADGTPVLVARAGGTVRAYHAIDGDIAWCSESRRLETNDAAWTPDGRATYGDEDSLTPLPSVVFKGVVYVDPTAPAAPPPPGPAGPPPACGDAG